MPREDSKPSSCADRETGHGSALIRLHDLAVCGNRTFSVPENAAPDVAECD